MYHIEQKIITIEIITMLTELVSYKDYDNIWCVLKPKRELFHGFPLKTIGIAKIHILF